MSEQTKVDAYPLSWPPGKPRTPAGKRERAKFGRSQEESRTDWQGKPYKITRKASLTIEQAQRRLSDELARLGAKSVVISSDLRLRLDGLPYSQQREPADPGVAVYFQLLGKPHCLSCDAWDRAADNLAAIAKHIDAMRGMERWGVADIATLFAGFKALPAATVTEWRPRTAEEAAEWVARTAKMASTISGNAASVLSSKDVFDSMYRIIAKSSHPDTNGGKETVEWRVLQAAKELIEAAIAAKRGK